MDDRLGQRLFQLRFDGCAVADVEVAIGSRDLESFAEEPWNQVSTDEAPRARDENPHRPQPARLADALLAGESRRFASGVAGWLALRGRIGAIVGSGRF